MGSTGVPAWTCQRTGEGKRCLNQTRGTMFIARANNEFHDKVRHRQVIKGALCRTGWSCVVVWVLGLGLLCMTGCEQVWAPFLHPEDLAGAHPADLIQDGGVDANADADADGGDISQ